MSGVFERRMGLATWVLPFLITAGLALIAPASSGATPFFNRFIDSNQSFVVLQNGAKTPAPFVATGGNPDGYIQYTDATAETGCPALPCDISSFEGPNPLLGTLTANYGGTWSFDFKTNMPPSLNKKVYLIIYDSSGQGLVWGVLPANTTNWQHFSGSLTAPGWLLYDFGAGTSAPPTEAQFKAVLANATAINEQTDVYTGSGEQYGLDNLVFTDGPPPASPPDNPPGSAATDTTPPSTTISKASAKVLHARGAKTKVRFSFTSSEVGSTFKCKLDNKQFKPCTSPKIYRVKPGKHVFQVRAIDAAGNPDATPAKRKFKVLPAVQ